MDLGRMKTNSGGAKRKVSLLHVNRRRWGKEWRRWIVFRHSTISQGWDIPKVYRQEWLIDHQKVVRQLYCLWSEALQNIIWWNWSPLCDCQRSTANNWIGSWVQLWATHECTYAVTKNNETRLLLDYNGSRLRSLCLEVPSMPSPWRSEAYAIYAITYHDFTLALLYLGNRYYWEDSPNNIQ